MYSCPVRAGIVFPPSRRGATLDQITEPKLVKSRLGVPGGPILPRVRATRIAAEMAERNE